MTAAQSRLYPASTRSSSARNRVRSSVPEPAYKQNRTVRLHTGVASLLKLDSVVGALLVDSWGHDPFAHVLGNFARLTV